MPVSQIDLLDLAQRLKREKLFVANEKKEIEGLNRKVSCLTWNDIVFKGWEEEMNFLGRTF